MRILVHLCCGPCGITVLQRLGSAPVCRDTSSGLFCAPGQDHKSPAPSPKSAPSSSDDKLRHFLTAFFFNPNIQPLSEYMRRREGALQVAERLGVSFIPVESLSVDKQEWDDPWLDGRRVPKFTPGGACAVPPAVNQVLWLRAVSGREGERCMFCWRIRLRKTAQLAAERGFDGFTSSLLYSRHQDHAVIRELGESIAKEIGFAFLYEDFRASWQEGIRLSREWGIYRQPYCGCCFSEYDRYASLYSRSLLP